MAVRSRVMAVPGRFRRRMAGGVYRAEIDGLRFVAIAIVVVGHFMERALRFFPRARSEVESLPFGELVHRPGLGVYLFFTISGFILAGAVARTQAAPLSAAFLRRYFSRRILRIEPPYLLLLVATWLIISLSGYRPEQTTYFNAGPQSLGASLACSIVYLHDLVWGVYPRLFPPGWSLEVEVQFYILAPLLFWVYFNLRHRASRVALGFAGLLLGSLASLLAPDSIGAVHVEASLLRFFHFFWLGILLADLDPWIVERTKAMPALAAGLLGWAGLAVYLVLPSAPDDLTLALLNRAAALASIAALFVSAFALRSSFRTFCMNPWISLIGGACYSLYLVHLQTIQAVTGLVAKVAPTLGTGMVMLLGAVEIAAVLAIGLGFYALVERSFMIPDWPRLLARRVVSLWRPAGTPRLDRLVP